MNKKVLITGGSGDIAQEIKKKLEKKGYDILAPNRFEMDVTDSVSIKKTIDNFTPDILINNAGYVFPKSIREADIENIDKHISINLTGVFYTSSITLKNNPNALIINICSAASIEPHATWSEYCATKAAVAMATKCWANDNIYSVSISPARTKTKMRKFLFPDEDQNTLLLPKDFARVVLLAVEKKIPSGSNIIVRKQNVNSILEEYK